MRIALDAMGGDYAPKNTIEGAVLALREYPFIEKLFLVGDAVAIGSELKRLDCKDTRTEIFHASEVVSMKDSAAKAVRQRRMHRFAERWILLRMGRPTQWFPLDIQVQP